MYNVAMRIVNHEGEAEDVLQESFVDAFQHISELRDGAVFGGWLRRIVVNRAINSLRRKRLVLFEDVPDHYDPTPGEADSDMTAWNVARVRHAITLLPDGYRLVLSLYLLEGYDHSEIAQILSITETTSKTQYSRAKDRVRALLKINKYEGQY